MRFSFFDKHFIAYNLMEGFFRLSAFGHRENVIEAVERIKKNLK